FAWRVDLPSRSGAATLWRARDDGAWDPQASGGEVAVGEFAIEVRIGLGRLGFALDDEVSAVAATVREGIATETIPTSPAVPVQPAEVLAAAEAPIGSGGDAGA